MHKMKRLAAVLGVAVAASITSIDVGGPAQASEVSAVVDDAAATSGDVEAQACGFVGGETYRHCGNTHVLIDARNIWGTTYRNICVGPGDTHLGHLSTWVIQYAWYIGKLC
ncbi:MAG TPA: DUF6355 family natural product biosynthesis protein [Acidimicrobiales bacterium]|nr:DUF6355 family natural product biosynthesis protein [Acidimicrobiales bacterium]